jgi:hypothetical protein
MRSAEQVGRGLSGPLIVEEREPIRVDREVVWLLSDWRLLPDAQISGDFGNMHDMSHNGRLGNTVTVNGRIPETFAVRSGERIRLRLINAANARIFGLTFGGHRPMVIAYDGQPVEPHEPAGGRIVLGPAMRIDLILDMTAKPGERFPILDTFYRGLQYRLLDLAYGGEVLREKPLGDPIALPAHTMPEPDVDAEREGLAHQRRGPPRSCARADAGAAPRPLLCPRHEQRDRLVASHAPARACVPGDRPQRQADAASRVAGHRPDRAARDGRNRVRRG